jgi:HEAT repeat protein
LLPSRGHDIVGFGEELLAKGFVMRIVMLVLCAPPLLMALGETAIAQKKGEPKPDLSPGIQQIAGKTLDQWVAEFRTTKDPSRVENAIRTILLFGAEPAQRALPHLLAILRKHTPNNPIDSSVRVNATIALGVILNPNVKDPPEQKYIHDAVTLLTRLLRDPERIIRYRAAEALGFIGPDAKAAIPDLIYNTRDPLTFETRQAAAFALGFVAQDEKKGPSVDVLAALYRCLKDSAMVVRKTAVQSIARLGPPNDQTQRLGLEKELEPVALRDPEPIVQIWAHLAVMRLNKKLDDWRAAAIGKMLTSTDVLVRIQAAQALSGIGQEAKKEIPRLRGALSDPEPLVVHWSMVALAQMGKEAVSASEQLRKIANDPQQTEATKRTAQEALDMIEGRAKGKGNKGGAK